MIRINEDDNTILEVTRGNTTNPFYRIAITFPLWNFETEEEENYVFQLTDKITFSVYEKKGYTKKPIFTKSYLVSSLYNEPTESVEIPLTDTDTNKFELLNKKRKYWYDIVLNDTTTILGFDEKGGKQLIVYPEVEEE